MTHRYLTVQDLVVRPDDLDVHITHCHKVPHRTLAGGLHGLGPLTGHLFATFLGGEGAVLVRFAHYGKAQVAHPLPVLAQSLVDFQQYPSEKRHGAQHGYAVGMLRLRLEGSEEQQLLPGQLFGLTPVFPHAQAKVQRGVPLPNLHQGGVGAQHSGNGFSLGVQHHLAHALAAGDHAVQVLVQKGLDALLSPAGVHGGQETAQSLLSPGIPTADLYPAAQPHQLPNGCVQNGDRLSDGAVEGDLSATQRHVLIQQPEGVVFPIPQLDLRGFPCWLFLLKPFQVSSSFSSHSRLYCRDLSHKLE